MNVFGRSIVGVRNKMLLEITRYYHGHLSGYTAVKYICGECESVHTELYSFSAELPAHYECECGFSEMFFNLVLDEEEEG